MARQTYTGNASARRTRRDDSSTRTVDERRQTRTRTKNRTGRNSRSMDASRNSTADESPRSERHAFRASSRSEQQSSTKQSRSMRSSKRDDRRRKRAKAKAERLFIKQEAVSQSKSLEEGPRAALYEGRMGSSHRRSARMQKTETAGSPSAKINPAGWFSTLHIKPSAARLATIAACVLLTAAFLYTPAQQYYQSQRENERLSAEYEALTQRNDALDFQNDSLASDAGIEDAVRQKFGYVIYGENTAIVTGLSDNATDTSRDSENIEANVLSSSVKAPEEWYTPYLDAFFGVQ